MSRASLYPDRAARLAISTHRIAAQPAPPRPSSRFERARALGGSPAPSQNPANSSERTHTGVRESVWRQTGGIFFWQNTPASYSAPARPCSAIRCFLRSPARPPLLSLYLCLAALHIWYFKHCASQYCHPKHLIRKKGTTNIF
jgi:hypothetical protein